MSQWAKWRDDLQKIGGWDNELVAVPAGTVRKMIERGEALEAALRTIVDGEPPDEDKETETVDVWMRDIARDALKN